LTALAWLNDLVQWFGRLVPRIVLVHPTHRGVRFGPRGSARCVGPGLVTYWPITHHLIEVPVTLQSVQLCAIQLPIRDESQHFLPRVAVCTLNVQFLIADPVTAATHILNFHALVGNRAQASVAAQWPGELPADATWILRAGDRLAQELRAFGITLATIDIAGLGLGVAVKNIGDWSYADQVNGKRVV